MEPLSIAAIYVMSFNIRLGVANDGENSWPQRKERVYAMLQSELPDVVGIQEAYDFQIDDILGNVPAYKSFGVGREDGVRKGEHSAILYRPDKLRLEAGGNFWFSNTPAVPNSMHWGNRITRMCTWARFSEKASGKFFYVFNLHIDHQSQPSREKAIELLLKQIEGRPTKDPVLVTGDFNAGESNPAVMAMSPTFKDSYRMIHPNEKVVGTFNGFEDKRDGDKIDYIFVDFGWSVTNASVMYGNWSDHFPVTARVTFKTGN